MTTLAWHERPAASPSSATPTVVLLHGFGAGGTDLVDLAPWLDPASRYRWLFPEAPWPMAHGGRAWFPRDSQEQSRALSGQLFGDLRNYSSPSIDNALDLLEKDLSTLVEGGTPLCIGGFSQGSMMATLLSACWGAGHGEPRGLVLLSSSLFWQDRLAEIPRLPPVFQSHGTFDPVLPFKEATALRDALSSKAPRWTWRSFEGSHEIPAALRTPLMVFLHDVFADPRLSADPPA